MSHDLNSQEPVRKLAFPARPIAGVASGTAQKRTLVRYQSGTMVLLDLDRGEMIQRFSDTHDQKTEYVYWAHHLDMWTDADGLDSVAVSKVW